MFLITAASTGGTNDFAERGIVGTSAGYCGYYGGDLMFQTFVETATPLPAALPLFATALEAMGLISRPTKRKAAAPAAA